MQSGEQITINGQRYQLGAVLSTGAGSYGQVWAAIDETGRTVALKFINTEAMFQAEPSLRGHWRAHLEREIDFLKKLGVEQSQHIVTLFDHGQIAGQPVLVMERLQANLGQWLAQRAQEGAPPLELDLILDWAGQILSGLEVIHDAGFVYRDLKLSNILVGDDGDLLKLADFGSLRRETGDSTRSFIGTPATMAPEQVLPVGHGPDGQEYAVDYRADYYALGLLLFTLITERPSTEAQRRLGRLLAVHGQEGASQQRAQLGGLTEDEHELLRRSIEFWTVPALPEQEHAGAAAPLTELIEQLLARDPAARPADGEAIRAVLNVTQADPPILSTPAMTTVTPDWVSASAPRAGAPRRHPKRVMPDWAPPLRTGAPRRHAVRSATSASSPWLRRSVGLAGILGLAGALAWTLLLPSSNPTRQQETPTPDIVSTQASPKSIAPLIPPAEPDAPAISTTTTAEAPESASSPTTPELQTEEPPSVADGTAPPDIEPDPDNAAETDSAPALAGSEATQSEEPEEPEEPPMAATPQEEADGAPVVAAPVKVQAPATSQQAGSSNRSSRSASTAKTTRTTAAAGPASKERVERVERAPTPSTPDSRVARPATKVPTSTASTPARTRRPPAKSVPRSSAKEHAASGTGRTAKATSPRPTPTRPTVASTRPPVVRAKPPASPSTPSKSGAPSAPPDLPPIKLTSRSRPTPPDLPPIKLTSRSQPNLPPIHLIGQAKPATSSSTTRTRSQTPAKSTRNQSSDSRPQIQRDVDQFTRWVGRTSAAVGSEVRRGLESVGQAISGTGGNNTRAQVERRDRWEPRYSER